MQANAAISLSKYIERDLSLLVVADRPPVQHVQLSGGIGFAGHADSPYCVARKRLRFPVPNLLAQLRNRAGG